MKTIVFENYKDLARDMIEESGHKKTISAFCLYDVTCKLIKELLMQDSNIEIRQIIIHDYEYSGYDKEYQITIYDGELYCRPEFGRISDGYRQDRYLDTYADISYIHSDCNSKILNYIECKETYEFEINEDNECDNTDCSDHDEKYGEVTISESVDVNRNHMGVPTDFSKSWSVSGGGMDRYCTFSYYSDDPDDLCEMANMLNVEI